MGFQEPFPLNGINIHVLQQDGTDSAGVLAESPTKNNPSEQPEKSTRMENGLEM